MVQSAVAKRKQDETPAVSCEDLRRQIVKLRWIGEDQEADALCRVLEAVAHESCVPTGPEQTD
jgi:hypothetical protein